MCVYTDQLTSKSAGEEISSTYEGRHLTYVESTMVHPVGAGTGLVVKGDPVLIGENIVGVAFTSAAAETDDIAIDSEGIWALDVYAYDHSTGNEVVCGDTLYIDTSTAVLSKDATGQVFGYALTGVGAGLTRVCAVKVHWDPRIEIGDIPDGAITEDKIANLAVTEGKIGALAVTEAKIGALAVAEAKIAEQAVTTVKIADAAVTQPQMQTRAVITIGDTNEIATAGQLVESGIFACTPGEARTLTTGTAAAIVAALPRAQVGTWFDVVVLSLAAHNVTFTAGDGVTVTGSAVINNASGTFRGLITNIGSGTEAVTFYRM